MAVARFDVHEGVEDPRRAGLDRGRKSAEGLIEAADGKAAVLRAARRTNVDAGLAGRALGIPARLEVTGSGRRKLNADAVELLELARLPLRRAALRHPGIYSLARHARLRGQLERPA